MEENEEDDEEEIEAEDEEEIEEEIEEEDEFLDPGDIVTASDKNFIIASSTILSSLSFFSLHNRCSF